MAMNVPQIKRGTISAETIVVGYAEANTPGYRPVIAQGYGLVVRLNGTGSRDIGPALLIQILILHSATRLKGPFTKNGAPEG